ncbi:MAG: hypothetical protein H7839_16770 [Magnetococcus sp. YQC-5]
MTDTIDLQGKRILFIDDQLDIMRGYCEALEAAKAKVEMTGNLKRALTKLSSHDKKYDIVIIDLFIPPLPDELKKTIPVNCLIAQNEGQALGAWLRKHKKETKYCYITTVYGVFQPCFEEGRETEVIDKYEVLPSQLPKKVVDILAMSC